MTKNILSLESNKCYTHTGLHNISLRQTLFCNRPLVRLARLYSELMGERISPRHTLHILHVQTALLAAVFPIDMPVVLRLAALAWAGISLYKLRCTTSATQETLR